jgi:hypothetical protein
VMDDSTIGGYFEAHDRPPAFEGPDGGAYSAEVWVDDTPDADGRYAAAVLFVRWSESGDRPVDHVETPILAFGESGEDAAAQVRILTLLQVKAHLDQAIEARRERADW